MIQFARLFFLSLLNNSLTFHCGSYFSIILGNFLYCCSKRFVGNSFKCSSVHKLYGTRSLKQCLRDFFERFYQLNLTGTIVLVVVLETSHLQTIMQWRHQSHYQSNHLIMGRLAIQFSHCILVHLWHTLLVKYLNKMIENFNRSPVLDVWNGFPCSISWFMNIWHEPLYTSCAFFWFLRQVTFLQCRWMITQRGGGGIRYMCFSFIWSVLLEW